MGCGCDEKFTGAKTSCKSIFCLGEGDLCLGCGETEQNRHGRKVTITKINAGHIMYCPSGKPIAEYIEDLRRMFPYIECNVGRPTMDYLKWEDAVITGDIDSCAIGLPGEVVQRIPFMEGDVANHGECLWESLVNDNLTEPTIKNQRDGLWLNKCSLIDAINCLFPVEDNASCDVGCDEVKPLPTLCERTTDLEECVFPKDASTLCERTTDLEERTTDLEECVFPKDAPTLCERVVDLEECCETAGQVVTSILGLPAGAVRFSKSIQGNFTISASPLNKVHYVLGTAKTFLVSDYPLLKEAGVKINLLLVGSTHYYCNRPTIGNRHAVQGSTYIKLNGELIKDAGDAYLLAGDIIGHFSDNYVGSFITTGEDITIEAGWTYLFENDSVASDHVLVDYANMAITFTKG